MQPAADDRSTSSLTRCPVHGVAVGVVAPGSPERGLAVGCVLCGAEIGAVPPSPREAALRARVAGAKAARDAASAALIAADKRLAEARALLREARAELAAEEVRRG